MTCRVISSIGPLPNARLALFLYRAREMRRRGSVDSHSLLPLLRVLHGKLPHSGSGAAESGAALSAACPTVCSSPTPEMAAPAPRPSFMSCRRSLFERFSSAPLFSNSSFRIFAMWSLLREHQYQFSRRVCKRMKGRTDLRAPLLVDANVASMQHSDSSSSLCSGRGLAQSVSAARLTSFWHHVESGGAPFCSSGRTAVACAIMRRCSESTAQLKQRVYTVLR